jgi:16S rRNA G1207 methylase RsmC
MFKRQDITKLKQNLHLKTQLLGFDFDLQTKFGVFSPKAIDEGTVLLLKYLQITESDVCLDLGCGYGPIGLSVAKIAKEVHMIDKDFVAVDLSKLNAKNNNLNNCQIYLSDAFSNVPKDIRFSQIISNIPAKVGREQLSIILYDAYDAMDNGGVITFVSINGLRDFLKNNFKEVFGNYKKIKQGAKYTISQATKITK